MTPNYNDTKNLSPYPFHFIYKNMIQSLAFQFQAKKKLLILDQSLLPEKKVFIEIKNPKQMALAIKDLKIRGANLIGILAAFSLVQYLLKKPKAKDFVSQAEFLKTIRPTAIHLTQAVDSILKQKTIEAKLNQALALYEEDKKACENIALLARPLIKKGEGILTYCNTGSLATAGEGTALGLIKQAFRDKKQNHIYVCETRPVNQGSRLTFWELQEENIPSTLICDNMLASLISKKKIQKAFVGADRISQNGDLANKIGTYNLAVICKHFKIPFYVATPTSSFDKLLHSGKNIPIEQRDPQEISSYWAKTKASIWNPSFDITPKELIAGFITEKEILRL